jgi:putative transcriptional regulator
MIRIMFKQLLDEKAFGERRRISIQEVCEETGISRPTMTRIANVPGYNATIDVLDSLCSYFDCEPGDLLKRVREDK